MTTISWFKLIFLSDQCWVAVCLDLTPLFPFTPVLLIVCITWHRHVAANLRDFFFQKLNQHSVPSNGNYEVQSANSQQEMINLLLHKHKRWSGNRRRSFLKRYVSSQIIQNVYLRVLNPCYLWWHSIAMIPCIVNPVGSDIWILLMCTNYINHAVIKNNNFGEASARYLTLSGVRKPPLGFGHVGCGATVYHVIR